MLVLFCIKKKFENENEKFMFSLIYGEKYKLVVYQIELFINIAIVYFHKNHLIICIKITILCSLLSFIILLNS